MGKLNGKPRKKTAEQPPNNSGQHGPETRTRRAFLKTAPAVAAAAVVAVPAVASAQGTSDKPVKKVFRGPNAKPPDPANPPMFNGTVLYGNLVFISGIGYHQAGDITVHTTKVLEQMKAQLEACGSSMEKVLKVNVYLNDLKDYDAMNAVFKGKFGPEPGVRTTIAAAGGIPGNSLVEIDCIACI
jgi:2-iminobutanoate/2-iminopropanoate deaminase